jgi:hypothetical protein
MARIWYPDAEVRDLIEGPPKRILTEKDFDLHQIWMADLTLRRKAAILAAEMGLGKTGAVLHGMIELLKRGHIKKWLVIAPLRVAEETWPDEMWKWDFAREYTYRPILGNAAQRTAALSDPAPIHFINRENLKWLWVKLRKDWPYDGLVYDESSRLKAGKKRSAITKRTDNNGTVTTSGGKLNEFGSLAQAREAGKFKRVIEMTGTPAASGLADLWGQMYLIDGGHRLGADRKSFMSRWFDEGKYDRKITPKDGAEEEIMDLIKDAMFSLKEEDHLTGKLPPLMKHERWVTLPEKAMATYRELSKEFCLEEYDVAAVNNGVLANKLLQLSNGSIYDVDGNDCHIHDRKLEELEAIHHGAGGRPMLIAYSFQFDKKRILERFPKFRVFGETDHDMRDWNDGKIPGLLVHPASAGHGMNFQFGSNIMVWYGLTWSLELFLQFNKRIHRRGQEADRVHQYFILAKGTYDERQFEALYEKGVNQTSITDRVRVMQDDMKKALR